MEQNIPHASQMFHLPIEVSVYVPSTQDVDKVISKTEMNHRINEVKEYLAKLFGGYSSTPIEGGFLASNNQVVSEDVEKVTSFAQKEDFDKHKEALVVQCSKWADKWGQEAIGLEHEGDLYYVPQKFEHGGDFEPKGAIQMAMIQAEKLEHHVKELKSILRKSPKIEAWIIAKLESASTDLENVTHYLGGLESIKGQEMAKGGNVSEKMVKVNVDYLEQQYFRLEKQMEIPLKAYKKYEKTGKVERELLNDLISETCENHWIETNALSVVLTPLDSKIMENGGDISDQQESKIGKVMREFKEGKLHSSSGDLVTDRKQAIAIALSEAEVPKKEQGGNIADYEYLKNKEISKIITKDGREIDSTSILDGAYIKNDSIEPKEETNKPLLALNGKPSNLTPEQYKLVRSPEFINWFGDWINDPKNASKVVDENGEPLVVYHGTQFKFNVFDKTHLGKTTKFPTNKLGFYFSGSKLKAKNLYANFDRYNLDNIVLNCFLRIINPFNTTAKEFYRNNEDFKVNLLKQQLEANKNDGIIVLAKGLSGHSDEYTVFEPNQIKLADGTNTTFDPNNDDIRFEEGGSVNDPKQDMNNFDFSSLFSNNEPSTPIKDESDYNAEKIALIQSEIDSQIVTIENQLKDWASRVYKSNKNIIYTDNNDIHGDALTIDSINESKRSKKVQTLSNEIESLVKAKEILSNYNIHREGDINANILKDFSKEDYIKKGKKMSSREQMIIDDAYDKIIKLLKANDNNSQFKTGGNVSETLLAPNGEPTKLTPKQYKLVRSPEFINWFGDWINDPQNASKVVDSNGEPLVCYHGSDNKFNTFDIKKARPDGFHGKGFYFATSDLGYGNNLYACFLNFRKPFDINADYSKDEIKAILKDRYSQIETLIDEEALISYNGLEAGYVFYSFAGNDALREAGFDGLIHSGIRVAFEPNQIKLANGKNTTFDPTNNDIRFEKGGNVSEQLLAPNGEPSNLTLKQYQLVRTPEFINWFGDWINDPQNASKVVDRNGEPLLVYHGTDNEFHEFDTNKQIKGWFGKGFYFSKEKTQAKDYGKVLLKCFLNLRNPFIPKGDIVNSDGTVTWGIGLKGEISEKYGNVNPDDISITLKEFRNDGIIEGDMISCFYPNQIKLADGTNTTFDPTNNDIRFEKGGDLDSKTPAPIEERISGSKFNEAGSSKDLDSANEIKFDENTISAIANKVQKHNKDFPDKKITLASAKAVVRRGMGAYSSSHRPTITDGKPNSRVAWGLARLNAFIYKVQNGKSESGKYVQDDDLIQELGIRFEDGGNLENDGWNNDYENDPMYKFEQKGKEYIKMGARAGMAYLTKGKSEMGNMEMPQQLNTQFPMQNK